MKGLNEQFCHDSDDHGFKLLLAMEHINEGTNDNSDMTIMVYCC